MPAPVTALRALAGVARGEPIPAERMGRLMSYERERFERERQPPRLAVGLAADGTPAQPPHLALGSWRLASRLVVDDAITGHAAALGIRLCERAARVDPALAVQLVPAAVRAAEAVLGPGARQRPLSAARDWEELRFELLAARPANGMIGITTMQHEAEARLRAIQIPGISEFFGAEAPLGVTRPPSQLRRPLPGEKGETFDDLLRRRAGESQAARDVLAFVQEWGRLADELDRPVTRTDYIDRWGVSAPEAARRLELFHRVLPYEPDPGPLWELLWEGARRHPEQDGGAEFVRRTSRELVDTYELPELAPYFLASLDDQVTRLVSRHLRAAGAIDVASAPRTPHADITRLFSLADVALHGWAAAVVPGCGGAEHKATLAGLMSLEAVTDEDSAGDASAWLGHVRRGLPGGSTRQVLRHAQRCLRSCAALSTLEPPSSSAPLLPAVRLAAATLASAASAGAVDVAHEARHAVAVLTA